ncbi:MAG: hypothetical protein A2Z35_04900 [Actinobacteria bacterium RBG_19FT_COMBO_36_27]|nr:MAG: hypothetical protein A2Z35_04900 [Actinobacteria bacterium RBG_19FT_COMBO_36_27]
MLEQIISKIDVIKSMSVVLILIGIIVLAIVERIKAETKLKSFWYTIISIGVGCGIFAIFVYAPVIIIAFLFVGLLASGIFDITKKI